MRPAIHTDADELDDRNLLEAICNGEDLPEVYWSCGNDHKGTITFVCKIASKDGADEVVHAVEMAEFELAGLREIIDRVLRSLEPPKDWDSTPRRSQLGVLRTRALVGGSNPRMPSR